LFGEKMKTGRVEMVDGSKIEREKGAQTQNNSFIPKNVLSWGREIALREGRKKGMTLAGQEKKRSRGNR